MAKLADKPSRSQAIKAGIARAKEGRAQVAEANTLLAMFGLSHTAYYERLNRVEWRLFPFHIMGGAPFFISEHFSRADHMRTYVNRLITRKATDGI